MQTSVMKACFQIAECSFSSAKIGRFSHIAMFVLALFYWERFRKRFQFLQSFAECFFCSRLYFAKSKFILKNNLLPLITLTAIYLLFEVDEHLHARLTVTIDKLVCVIILLEGEAVADERLQIDDALAHIVDGGEVVLVAIHHRANQSQLVLAEIEHAEGWILGENGYHHDIASLLDGLHQGADGDFHTSYLETYLIPPLLRRVPGQPPSESSW